MFKGSGFRTEALVARQLAASRVRTQLRRHARKWFQHARLLRHSTMIGEV